MRSIFGIAPLVIGSLVGCLAAPLAQAATPLEEAPMKNSLMDLEQMQLAADRACREAWTAGGAGSFPFQPR